MAEYFKLIRIVDSLRRVGNLDRAIELYQEIDGYQKSYFILFALARLYAEQQNSDQTFTCLNRAFKIALQNQGLFGASHFVTDLKIGNDFNILHADPRWTELEQKIEEGREW